MREDVKTRRAGRTFVGQHFEEALGPANARYFGGGFRRVSHFVESLSVDSATMTTELRAVGTAMYPEDWSLDAAGRSRAIHLSSFDAIALTAATVRAAATRSSDIDALLDKRVRRLRVKAPSNVIPVAEDIEIAVRCATVKPQGETRVSARVGRFIVEVTAESGGDGSHPLDLQLHEADKPAALGAGRVVPGIGGGLHAVQRLAAVPASLTCVEELAMFGQLSQIAVYSAKGLDRRSVPNLWLRELSLDHTPAPLVSEVTSRTTITRDRVLRIGGAEVADLALSSETSNGAAAEASFGFRVPPEYSP